MFLGSYDCHPNDLTIFSLLAPLISKEDTQFTKAISAAERLALVNIKVSRNWKITNFFDISFSNGKEHCFKNIKGKTCEAIYQVLSDKYVAAIKN